MNIDSFWMAMSFAWSDSNFSDDEIHELLEKFDLGKFDARTAYIEAYLFIFPSWWFNSIEALLTAGLSLPWGGQGYSTGYVLKKRRWRHFHLAICVFFPIAWLGLILSVLVGRDHLHKIIRASSDS